MEIKPNQIWQHYKGKQYIIVCLSKRETDKVDLVNYKRFNPDPDEEYGEQIWTRPIYDFLEVLEIEIPTMGYYDSEGNLIVIDSKIKCITRFTKIKD